MQFVGNILEHLFKRLLESSRVHSTKIFFSLKDLFPDFENHS